MHKKLLALMCCILVLTGCGKTYAETDYLSFMEACQEYDYELTDCMDESAVEYASDTTTMTDADDTVIVSLYTFPSEDDAESWYNTAVSYIKDTYSFSKSISSSYGNKQNFEASTDEYSYYYTRVGKTVSTGTAVKSAEDEMFAIRENIGY